ncbi:MAG TPA: sigma-70 family RNA polymerase sigma factor [Pyrinomonadaceae bacterium]|nr:sigma-70 family RNA polymerase sigma factor [Pyrinomonadaceae bacterium]
MTANLDNEATAKPAEWLEAYGDCLYRYAMFRLRDMAAAEDAVQETLLAAQVAMNTRPGNSSERTWLVEILKQQIIRHCPRIVGTPDEFTADVSDETFFETSGEWLGHWREEMAPTDWQFDATSALKRAEFWKTLDRCLSELPRVMALAFTLREIDGLSSEEVCDVLNISCGNLRSLLHNARLRLRNLFESERINCQPPKSEPISGGIAKQSGISGLERALRSAQARFLVFVRFQEVLRLIAGANSQKAFRSSNASN